MPIYSFQCQHCEIIEDKLLKLEERVNSYKETCCICGQKDVEFKRVPSTGTSFRIKGKGVYKKTSSFD